MEIFHKNVRFQKTSWIFKRVWNTDYMIDAVHRWLLIQVELRNYYEALKIILYKNTFHDMKFEVIFKKVNCVTLNQNNMPFYSYFCLLRVASIETSEIRPPKYQFQRCAWQNLKLNNLLDNLSFSKQSFIIYLLVRHCIKCYWVEGSMRKKGACENEQIGFLSLHNLLWESIRQMFI